MPTILPEGIRVPAGVDPYALTDDLRKMMESATTIVPVANVTQRTALVAGLVAAGRPPTAADPVFVDRADAPAGANLERTTDGTNWRIYDSRASTRQWTTTPAVGAWNPHPDVGPLQVTRDGDWISAQGGLALGSGSVPFNFSGVTVATCPAGFLPKREKEFPCVSNLALIGWRILANGEMRIRAHGGAPSAAPGSYVILDGVRWEAAS